jgi:Domain of unknown function DUF1828
MPTLDPQRLADLCMVLSTDVVPKGHVRLETKFSYPDGTSVDLFVAEPVQPTLFANEPHLLTDFAQTTAWLADVQVQPWKSKKRQGFLDEVLAVLGVRQNGGALEAPFDDTRDSLESAVIRLGQACVRVADLYYTRRASFQYSTLNEDVEELLVDADLRFQPNVQILGKFGKPVPVDFQIDGQRTHSLVLTLSSQSTASSHQVATEVFRRQFDLASGTRKERQVTIVDDRYDVFKDEDLQRLARVSSVVPFSARKDLVALLAA